MADEQKTEPAKSEPAKTAAPAVFDPFEWRPFDTLRRFGHLIDWPARKSFPEFEAVDRFLTGLSTQPAVDVAEKGGEYEITVELPGLDEKDVELRLANGALTISGEKKAEREEKDKDYHFSERRYGAFRRSFRIPDTVDPEKIEASFEKGVLKVVLPKTQQAESGGKKIEIKSK